MQEFLRRFFLFPVLATVFLAILVTGAPAQGVNGTLGLFFDERGERCSTELRPGNAATLWVLLFPEGDTRSGIFGVEFSIDTSEAPGYTLSAPEVRFDYPNGYFVQPPDLVSGWIVVSGQCKSGNPIPIMRMQVRNIGSGGVNGVLQISPMDPPSNREFPCPLVLLCDEPTFTKVCMEIGPRNIAVLNPSGARPCGITAESSQWGAVKELYR